MTLYRPMTTTDDRRFVISAWSSSYKRSHSAGIIMADDWAGIMHHQLGKLIDRPNVRTIVAYGLPSSLYGFICGETAHAMPVVHYVYVKDPYRSELHPDGARTGPRHARGLFAELGVDPARPFLHTCRTFVCGELRDCNKIPLARFVPAAARYANYHEFEERYDRRSPQEADPASDARDPAARR